MKYFQKSTERVEVGKEAISLVEQQKAQRILSAFEALKELQQSFPLPKLQHPKGRVLIRVNPAQKNAYTLQTTGQEIQLERDVENLDRAYTQQVLGECVSGEGIPRGAMVLFHFNAIHDVNTVFDHGKLSGSEIAAGFKIISIVEDECFTWNNGDGWQPIYPFVFIDKIYEPHSGLLVGIEPKEVKNTFFVKTGELAGKAVRCVANAAYRIIFRNEKGIDEMFYRCRHYGDHYWDSETTEAKQEITCIDDYATEQIQSGKWIVGSNSKDAKAIC